MLEGWTEGEKTKKDRGREDQETDFREVQGRPGIDGVSRREGTWPGRVRYESAVGFNCAPSKYPEALTLCELTLYGSRVFVDVVRLR